TLPFRAGRTRFVSLILLAWWDAALSVWLYWVGMVRVVAVALGWVLGLSRLLARLIVGFVRDIVGIPFAMSGMLMRGYLQPGVPWLAFMMLLFWCVLEAAVFTYTLEPRVAMLVADLTGADDSRYTIPVLYLLVLTLILASFACVQALVDAVRKRESKFLAQFIGIELFAMFFEVTFLYRGVVEVTMPWIARDNAAMLATAAFGWFGVRGLTWFLFGQYGTPPLLALIARQPLTEMDQARFSAMRSEPFWRVAMGDFRRGHEVQGSDRAFDLGKKQEIAAPLRRLGIELARHDGTAVTSAIDRFVYSAAVEADTPELRAARTLGIDCLPRPQLLAEVVNTASPGVAIAGTSGKSTIVGMIGWLLREGGVSAT